MIRTRSLSIVIDKPMPLSIVFPRLKGITSNTFNVTSSEESSEDESSEDESESGVEIVGVGPTAQMLESESIRDPRLPTLCRH